MVLKHHNANIVGCRWFYLHKFDIKSHLEHYKVRLFDQGFYQQLGLEFDDTSNPVVEPVTIHIVLSISISRRWPIHLVDVKNAFLHGDHVRTAYMYEPAEYANANYLDHVYRQCKALYGLKQAPRVWYL